MSARRLSPVLSRWLPAVLFAAALGAALWRLVEVAVPALAPPPPVSAQRLPTLFAAQALPASGALAGAPSLTQLPDGRIAAAWVAGSAATAADLRIHFSILDDDGWREAQPVASRESAAGGLFAHIRWIGRPQLYAEGSWLHLWYAALGVGGAANVALVHSVSTDGGRTWSIPARQPTSLLAGYATVPSGPPLPLADGALALPLRNLFSGGDEWLLLNANGRSVDKRRLPHPPGTLPVDPDTPLAMLRLPSGRLLLAAYPAAERALLALWLSADDGQNWRAVRHLEADVDTTADFSTPALLLGRDGRIHLAHAGRNGIRYASFSEAWLAGETP
ncbi:MAG: exo-alpha-sialidase [Betaproteobacteria bacterium]|nr:exo-alpha-sialidase [Betaproteobacteria bacterium]MCL2886362.1 exo-alpha-sialidase [Betaproteobacteria bacterium]